SISSLQLDSWVEDGEDDGEQGGARPDSGNGGREIRDSRRGEAWLRQWLGREAGCWRIRLRHCCSRTTRTARAGLALAQAPPAWVHRASGHGAVCLW
ncbi:unnamed protein product, partial [Urochloa humidicola]